MKSCMIHDPWGSLNPSSPCMKNSKCTKNFIKPYITKENFSEYPICKRWNDGNISQTLKDHSCELTWTSRPRWLILLSLVTYSTGIYNCIRATDVLLNGLSISAKGELQLLCCMMGKMISLRCPFLDANGWQLIDWMQKKIKLSI